MELKELAGNQDLFDVMKRIEKKKKMQEKKNEKTYHKSKSSEKTDVFDFINHRLANKKGKLACFFY